MSVVQRNPVGSVGPLLLEFGGQASLADSARPGDGHQAVFVFEEPAFQLVDF